MLTLQEKVSRCGFDGREWISVNVPFAQAREVFKPEQFSADSGVGEQRGLVEGNVKVIRLAVENKDFTPCAVGVGLRPEHQQFVLRSADGKQITLNLPQGTTLPVLDGGHRLEVFERLLSEGKQEVLGWDVPVLVHLNGDPKRDFLNLQKGRPVDKAHMQSLQVQTNLLPEKYAASISLAYKLAKALASHKDSPFYNQLRFDTRGASGIPVSSFTSKNASDLATSLVGAAKIIQLAQKDESWYVNVLLEAFKAIKAFAPETTDLGKMLCPPPSGTKGSATMIIGVANMYAYRLMLTQKEASDKMELAVLLKAVKQTMAQSVRGTFSGPVKRKTMQDFTDKLFADAVKVADTCQGVPAALVTLLSVSTFNLPKQAKKKGRPANAVPVTTTLDEEADAPEEEETEDESETPTTGVAPWEEQDDSLIEG
jgi:hypothetical protein